MNRSLIHIILWIGFIANSPLLKAQFINIQLNVEPEISASVEQNLEFGTQIINSGRNEIGLGDLNMGIFSIKAYYTQNVYLTLEYPEVLTHDNPAFSEAIPLELNLSYNNSGTNNVNSSTVLTGNEGLINIHENTQNIARNEIWQELFIYVYGYIDVGNIPNGVYTGDIVLTVDYD